jgi:hypothetical protein
MGTTLMKTQNTIIALALFFTAFTFGQNTFTNTGTNVGIGTTSPGSKLEILEATDSKPAGVLAPTKSIFKLSRSGTPNYSWPENAEFRIGHGGPNSYGSKLDLYINGSANTNGVPDQHAMTWNYDGNVGIGTTIPTAKLHINNGDNSYGAILATSTGNPFALYTKTLVVQPGDVESFRLGMKYDTNENNGFISFYRGQSSDGGFLGLSTNGLERMRLDRAGNVGIGMQTPTEKLEIAGNTKINGNLSIGKDTEIATLSGPTNSGAIQIKSHSGLGGAANRYLRLGWKDGLNNFSPALSINDDLNVGIGTTAPDAKLTVNGQIHTKEVRIDILQPMTVPDYVFANDYKLKTLNEVDQYVKANNHLPEIPSAAAMAQNGMLVSEMNLSLLKKIEELTLYAIEQQKKLEAMSERLSKLEKK